MPGLKEMGAYANAGNAWVNLEFGLDTDMQRTLMEEKISEDYEMNVRINRVGKRIAESVEKDLPEADWEFIVFENDEKIRRLKKLSGSFTHDVLSSSKIEYLPAQKFDLKIIGAEIHSKSRHQLVDLCQAVTSCCFSTITAGRRILLDKDWKTTVVNEVSRFKVK